MCSIESQRTYALMGSTQSRNQTLVAYQWQKVFLQLGKAVQTWLKRTSLRLQNRACRTQLCHLSCRSQRARRILVWRDEQAASHRLAVYSRKKKLRLRWWQAHEKWRENRCLKTYRTQHTNTNIHNKTIQSTPAQTHKTKPKNKLAKQCPIAERFF